MCSCRFDVSMGEGEPRILLSPEPFSQHFTLKKKNPSLGIKNHGLQLWWQDFRECGTFTSSPKVFLSFVFLLLCRSPVTTLKRERACVLVFRDSTAGRGKGDDRPCCSWSWKGGCGPMEAALRKREKSNKEVTLGAGVGQECRALDI